MHASKIGFNPNYSEEAPTIDEIKSLSSDAILEFGAPWCPHCQASMSIVQAVLSEPSFISLQHIKVYDGKGKRLGRSYKVKLWPTLIFLREGKEVSRIVRPLQMNDVRNLLQSQS